MRKSFSETKIPYIPRQKSFSKASALRHRNKENLSLNSVNVPSNCEGILNKSMKGFFEPTALIQAKSNALTGREAKKIETSTQSQPLQLLSLKNETTEDTVMFEAWQSDDFDFTSVDLPNELRAKHLEGNEQLTQPLNQHSDLTHRTHLDVSWSNWLKCLEDIEEGIENLTELTDLNLSECPKLESLKGIEHLTRLEHLNIDNCNALQDLKILKKLTNLRTLKMRGFALKKHRKAIQKSLPLCKVTWE